MRYTPSVIGLLTLLTIQAYAGGFQLNEYNAINTGNYGAGIAAELSDPSSAFTNPAGMWRIDAQQMAIAINGVYFDTQFHGTSTWNANLFGTIFPGPTEMGKANGGGITAIPAFHYVAPLDQTFSFGLSVTVPFGLETDYGNGSLLRYAATDTCLQTIDISPALSIRFNESISAGAGLDVVYADVRFHSIAGMPPAAFDSTSRNTGDDWTASWHGGILFVVNAKTRVGITYHAPLTFRLKGKSILSGPLTASKNGGMNIVSTAVQSSIRLPDWFDLSVFHQLTPNLALMATGSYTHWSVFDDIALYNIAAVDGGLHPQFTNVQVPQHFRSSYRIAAGANYHYSQTILLRFGAGYDLSPITNKFRTARAPDNNRFAVAIGGQYIYNDQLSFDLGWTHLFIKDASISNSISNGTAILEGNEVIEVNGKSKNRADVVGLQVNWKFEKKP